VVSFDFLHLVWSFIAANMFVPEPLDIKATFLDSKPTETIYMPLSEGYRDGNIVAYLKMCIY
jgi:hypothetical protein